MVVDWLPLNQPLYEMDLQTFIRLAPLQYSNSAKEQLSDTAGAWTLALELLHAGAVLRDVAHALHRDLKPSTIMLHGGHVVLINFGFAVTLSSSSNKSECYEQPGVVKGDLPYVLTQDVAHYHACRAGDANASGTVFRVHHCRLGGG